jgi:hypothetical protein
MSVVAQVSPAFMTMQHTDNTRCLRCVVITIQDYSAKLLRMLVVLRAKLPILVRPRSPEVPIYADVYPDTEGTFRPERIAQIAERFGRM